MRRALLCRTTKRKGFGNQKQILVMMIRCACDRGRGLGFGGLSRLAFLSSFHTRTRVHGAGTTSDGAPHHHTIARIDILRASTNYGSARTRLRRRSQKAKVLGFIETFIGNSLLGEGWNGRQVRRWRTSCSWIWGLPPHRARGHCTCRIRSRSVAQRRPRPTPSPSCRPLRRRCVTTYKSRQITKCARGILKPLCLKKENPLTSINLTSVLHFPGPRDATPVPSPRRGLLRVYIRSSHGHSLPFSACSRVDTHPAPLAGTSISCMRRRHRPPRPTAAGAPGSGAGRGSCSPRPHRAP